MQRIVYLILIFLVLTGITCGLFYYFSNKPVQSSAVLNAVPVDAAILIDIKKTTELFSPLLNDNNIWKELSKIPQLYQSNKDLNLIDSLFKKDETFKQLTENAELMISIHSNGKNKIELISYIGTKKQLSNKKFNSILSDYTKNKASISNKNYEGILLYEIIFSKPSRSYFVCNTQGIIICSQSQLLVEKSIRQLNVKTSLANDDSYKKVSLTAGRNTLANVYINFKNFSRLISILGNPTIKNDIQNFSGLANWAELDFRKINNDLVLFSGFTYTNDSSTNYLNLTLHQTPQKSTIVSVLPSNTHCFINIGISNFNTYIKDYINFLGTSNKQHTYNDKIYAINSTYNIDIEEIFYSIIDNEICLAYSSSDDQDSIDNAYTIIKTKSKSKAQEEMLKIITAAAQKTNKNTISYSTNFKIDNESSFDIYEMPFPDFPGVLFGKLFTTLSNKYFTFYDNYLIFGNSIKSLNQFIHFAVLHKTIATNNNYKELTTYLSDQSNVFIYLDNSASKNILKNILSKNLYSIYAANSVNIEKIQGCVLQLWTANNLIYNNLFLKYKPLTKGKSQSSWESLLDTIIQDKPTIVTNHITQEKEIILQDKKNNLYLINKSGRIIWKIQLNEKITGDIFQIDIFKNSKLQYLFSSKNYIHLIDRNGNYLEHYPLKLRIASSNPLALFDYENNKDYRFVIAGEDNKIYFYDKTGSLIKGWMFGKSESEITKKIQHFRIKDKDYIVFTDQNKVYILNRKGEIKQNFNELIKCSNNNSFIYNELNNNLVTTDQQGTICMFNILDGNIKKITINTYNPNHFFDFQDVDADGARDFIFLNKNKLEIFDQNKNEIYSKSFDEIIRFAPLYFSFSSDNRKIGIISDHSNEIFLLNSNGSIVKGFPLNGNTPFRISILEENLKRYNLIVGSNDNFLYNYTLQ